MAEARATTKVFKDYEIRVVQKEKEPWLIANDVCDALGLSDTADAVSRLGEKEKAVIAARTQSGAVREVDIVSIPGTYRLVYDSQEDAAKRFKRWLFHNVLPELQRSGW